MAVSLEFDVPASDFGVGRLLDAGPDGRVTILAVVPVLQHAPVRCHVEARDARLDALQDDLRRDYRVESVSVDERRERRAVFRVEWAGVYDELFESLREADAVVERAVGRDRWRFRVVVPDPGALPGFRRACAARGVDVDVDRVQQHPLESNPPAPRLTAPQYETLVAAYESGYFETPRQTTLEALGNEFGITRQAVANRLRRALHSLVGDYLRARRGGTGENERPRP
ncbi:MAG: helix-turn-helix domain-containing protein [Halobacterium sp.]